jgi:hypothetical protein
VSAFISVADETAVALLTDGAAYDQDGVILSLGRKVTTGRKAPIAVTTRGNHVAGRKHQKRICDLADEHGVDRAIELFETALPELASDPQYNGLDNLHWHICAWSETRGPIRFSAHNLPQPFSDGEEPLRLTEPSGVYCAGNQVDMADLQAAGLSPMRSGESPTAYMAREGVTIMEAMRRQAGAPLPGETRGAQYLIGGQCDLTLVTAKGATVRTVRTWPDRVGEVINPSGENVVALNRHQRRALARKAA